MAVRRRRTPVVANEAAETSLPEVSEVEVVAVGGEEEAQPTTDEPTTDEPPAEEPLVEEPPVEELPPPEETHRSKKKNLAKEKNAPEEPPAEEPQIEELPPPEETRRSKKKRRAKEAAPEEEKAPVAEAEQPDFGEGHGAKLRAGLFERCQHFLDYLALSQQELTTEHVHQLRVYSRRLSSSLSLLAGLVGAGPVKNLRRQLKEIRRSLCDLRDLQRQLEWLSDEPLLDEYLTERAAELPRVMKKARKKLARVRTNKLKKRLEMVDALLAALLVEENAEESAREVLSRHIWESLLRAMAHADEVDPDHSFSYHPLRTGLKTFRYQAEVFAAAGWSSKLDEHGGWAKLKELHDALGLLQDLEVLSCHLDFHWVEYPPIRESQARVINRLLKERHHNLGRIHLQDLDWEALWEWPKGEVEGLEGE